jgi:hypothetical protein
MKTRHRIALCLSVALLVLFFIGESGPGQAFLRGKAPGAETPFMADDRYMGAGLAPFAYCLLPACVLLLYAVFTTIVSRRRRGAR